MRRYPHRLAVEDRVIVWGCCRRMLVGYTVFAIILLLAALGYRTDRDSHDQEADEAMVRVDHFGVDDLAISLAPPPKAIDRDAAVAQKAPRKGAGLDPMHAR